ncbi:glycosyltransferase family 4 protein [Candidatus Amesbacteria bacterium]|nr:glycosyltransferase family 4 protein [Candidatus Amesbacteria bacterium]MBI2587338.1 glycosyltransferase family 4 protein [Candidatus Amesbacteria bacterium]
MRVLMFGWELPPFNSGGLGVACFGLARALAKKLDLIFILPHRLPVSAPFTLIFADLPPFNLSISPYSTTVISAESDPLFPDLLSQVYLYSLAAKKLARRLKFDIIHIHDWLTIPAGLAAKAVSGKPLVIHIHATEFDRSGGFSVNPIVYSIEQAGFHQADLIICVSEYVKTTLISRYGVDVQKVQVVYNAIDASDFPAATSPITFIQSIQARGGKIILYVGRITLQKGVDYLLSAAKIVLLRFPNAFFVIVGSGDMAHQIIQQAAAMGISDSVLFPGFLRGEQRNQMFASADLFVMPSVSEPFGLVPLESIVSGTPVLISKQSGVSEILHHALKVDFWDTQEMANQILAVLNYPSLPATLRHESSREISHFTWSSAADKVIEIYNNL